MGWGHSNDAGHDKAGAHGRRVALRFDGLNHAILVERVQQGDLAAQEVLLARHMRALKPMVHHRLPTYVRSMTDTDDVVQDVLVKTVGRLQHFESRNPMAFLAYLRRAVVNRIVDEVRRHARSGQTVPLTHDTPESTASPLERLLGKEQAEHCRAALSLLKPRDRQVILLRVSESLSYRRDRDPSGDADAGCSPRRAVAGAGAVDRRIETRARCEFQGVGVTGGATRVRAEDHQVSRAGSAADPRPEPRENVLSEGLCPSDSPTRALARRCVGALRARGSLATLARALKRASGS